MRYYVQIDGEVEEVEVTQKGDLLAVEHGGERFEISAATIEAGSRYSLLVGGRSLDVIVELSGTNMLLILNGHSHRLAIEDERERSARRITSGRSTSGPHVVKSPMPGVVRAVRATEGQHVRAGEPILILEAMKMENEIVAETAGRVEKVHVAAGATVNQGDALVVIAATSA